MNDLIFSNVLKGLRARPELLPVFPGVESFGDFQRLMETESLDHYNKSRTAISYGRMTFNYEVDDEGGKFTAKPNAAGKKFLSTSHARDISTRCALLRRISFTAADGSFSRSGSRSGKNL